jgi:hypothetical protein
VDLGEVRVEDARRNRRSFHPVTKGVECHARCCPIGGNAFTLIEVESGRLKSFDKDDTHP